MKNPHVNNVFVVDDNKLFLKGAKLYLQKHCNLNVQCYSSVIDCVRDLDKNPDLIFLDYHFNVKNSKANGFWGVKKIKSINNKMPIVMITNERSPGTIAKVMKEGAEDFLVKGPLAFEEMKSTIHYYNDKMQLVNFNRRASNFNYLFAILLGMIISISLILYSFI